MEPLEQVAVHVVESAMKNGATAAECVAREGNEFSATVRMGETEQLKEAGSKGLGVRVFIGQRAASSYTSDFSPTGVERLVSSALAAARLTSEDPYAGLPDPGRVGIYRGDLGLFSDDVPRLETGFRIELARRAEQAAFGYDPRIKNSEGGSFDAYYGRKVLATSQGFVGGFQRTSCSILVSPIAVLNGESGSSGMQRDFWYSVSRSFAGLESPESVGQKAAQRALRRLGARKVPTCRCPVIFDQRTARSLLGTICDAVNGDSIYRGASFLAGKLGEKVAAESVTIIDDATMPGGLGSSPFDDEGVCSGRTVVLEKGVLKSYLLNCYTARKLGLQTTGNAARGMAGNPGIGPNNFYLEAGPHSVCDLIQSIKNGFYITELIGMGVNVVTGDFSYGAAGLWIENGELAYPVEEVTVAGNLLSMLSGIAMIGSDLEFRGSLASPTLKIEEMTVAGN